MVFNVLSLTDTVYEDPVCAYIYVGLYVCLFFSLFMWVQPEMTRKLYIALWVAFVSSCVLPFKLLGFMIGESFQVLNIPHVPAPAATFPSVGWSRLPWTVFTAQCEDSFITGFFILSCFDPSLSPSSAVRRHQVLHHRLLLQELPQTEGQVRHAVHHLDQPAH